MKTLFVVSGSLEDFERFVRLRHGEADWQVRHLKDLGELDRVDPETAEVWFGLRWWQSPVAGRELVRTLEGYAQRGARVTWPMGLSRSMVGHGDGGRP